MNYYSHIFRASACKQAASTVQEKTKMINTGREGEVQKATENSKGASEHNSDEEQQKDRVNKKRLSKKGRKRKRKELQVARES